MLSYRLLIKLTIQRKASPCDLLGLVWVSRNMVGRTVYLDLLLLSSQLLWRGSHCLGGGVCHHSLRTHTGGNLSALNFNKLLSAELATSCWNGQFPYHSCPLCEHPFVVLRVLLSWERKVSSVPLVWPIFVLLFLTCIKDLSIQTVKPSQCFKTHYCLMVETKQFWHVIRIDLIKMCNYYLFRWQVYHSEYMTHITLFYSKMPLYCLLEMHIK